jgi:hypothetical protein
LEFCEKHSPHFKVVLHIYRKESYPSISFDDKELIKDMALLNSTFGIDYSIYDDEVDI